MGIQAKKCTPRQRETPNTIKKMSGGRKWQMTFVQIWNSNSERDWNRLLQSYWALVHVDNIQLEYSLNRLTLERVASMNERSWYAFLHDEYFPWKYTAKNRLATTRKQLERYAEEGHLDVLDDIRSQLLNIEPALIAPAIELAWGIRGLGISGASGLLSLMYPEHFATVDQFVVKALREVPDHRAQLEAMNPMSLTLPNGVVLTEIIRAKAAELNARFRTYFWTPRTIEMALWAYRAS